VHGDAYEYDAASGPTIELAIHFQVRSVRVHVLVWTGCSRSCGRVRNLPREDVSPVAQHKRRVVD
jgi:hypothetical protein